MIDWTNIQFDTYTITPTCDLFKLQNTSQTTYHSYAKNNNDKTIKKKEKIKCPPSKQSQQIKNSFKQQK